MNEGLNNNSLGKSLITNSTYNFYGMNEASFVDVLLKYSTAGISVLVGGYALMASFKNSRRVLLFKANHS